MNNNSVPDWKFDGETFTTHQKKPIGPDQDLMELLWQNGQVVLHSQTQRKPNGGTFMDSRQVPKNDGPALRTGGSYGNSSNLVQEEETVSWIQYPLEDPLEHEFCSNFLSELPSCEVETEKPIIKQFEEGKFVKFGACNAPQVTSSLQLPANMKHSSVEKISGNPMPAPRFHFPDSSQKNLESGGSRKFLNFSQFSTPPKFASTSSSAQFGVKGSGNILQNEARECSVMTIGSSHCGSNQIHQDPDMSRASSNGVWTNNTLSAELKPVKDDVQRTIPQCGKGKSETLEPTVTSSSGDSGSSLGRTCTRVHGQKRKATDAEESEEQSEATELKSAAGNKASQQTGSSRRNRAAEVHNLSERRRRDRINEKMRTLQQLIPHSNKTDKASMLDEAIEYLKSLQLQLQVMWMGAGITPMMFPGIQHYMSQMGMGMAAPSLPPIHNPMNLPRVPLEQSLSASQTPNQNVICQNPVLNPFNYQNQMQNPALSEQYARYMGYHLMQSASQPMNVFRYGSQPVQHGQTMIPPSNNSGPLSGAANTDDAVN